jgi:hypothetical protein
MKGIVMALLDSVSNSLSKFSPCSWLNTPATGVGISCLVIPTVIAPLVDMAGSATLSAAGHAGYGVDDEFVASTFVGASIVATATMLAGVVATKRCDPGPEPSGDHDSIWGFHIISSVAGTGLAALVSPGLGAAVLGYTEPSLVKGAIGGLVGSVYLGAICTSWVLACAGYGFWYDSTHRYVERGPIESIV